MQPSRVEPRALAYGLASAGAMALFVGIPTVLIPNPWFSRMVATRPVDYLVFAASVLLAAALGATYALPTSCSLQEGKVTAGGVLSLLAVGCPTCNKVVVAALGTTGAVTYFQPLQPLLALAGVALLGAGLWVRLRAVGVLVAPLSPEPEAGTGG